MMCRAGRRIVLILLTGLGVGSAAQALTLGVLTDQSQAVMEARFQPLADYLATQLNGMPVDLKVLDADPLQHALTYHQIDIVLTNPSSYLVLRSQSSLSGALVTMLSLHKDKATSSQAGVIITAATRTEVNTLADLQGRRIAIPGTRSLGGFLAPAFELLQAGIPLPRNVSQLKAGGSTHKSPTADHARPTFRSVGSHDAVVAAVLDGSADVGFVRTGTLERLGEAGQLDLSRLRIINRQPLTGFPYIASTRLYPEWPVVALPRVDDNTVRRVTAALLTLEAEHPAARAAGIAGFAPPADYLPVENLARILRLPPYEHLPTLTWRELWEQRRGTAILAGLSALLVLSLLAQIVVRNRRLTRSKAAVNDALAEQRAILTATPYPIFEVDATGRVLRSWAPNVRTTTIAPERMVGRRMSEVLPPDANDTLMRALHEASEHGQAQGHQFSLPTAEGERWFEASIGLIAGSARPQRFAVLVRNITTQRENEQWPKVAASVFTHAGEGILISDPDSRVVAANQALKRIMGYPDNEDLVGRYTHDLRLDYLAGESFITLRQSLAQTGSWHGEIRGQRDSGELYSATLNINVARDEAGQISHYVAVLTDVTELKMQQDQLEHVAYHDALTNLPNRTLLADRLQQAMVRAGRRNERVAVVYVDLDGFKTVNDGYGHDQGDALLIAIAQRMRGVLREGDTLARIGGDEFVAVLADLRADVDATPLLERLLTAANEPVQLTATELHVSASLGVTFFPQPDQSVEADQLLRQADQALYQAKLAGKNRYQIYDPAQDQAVKSRHERLQEIRHALQREEFVLYYQPKVNLRSGRVTGAEALIRWQHPQRGLLAPAVFLPVIENHPLGIELGEWVIESALRQIELWRKTGLDLPVSVNISADHLQQPAFTASLIALLAAHPSVAPSALEIEVLETSALADLEQVSQVMRACGDIGVNFALDDFGTGYSSLLYLKHLPAATLKIDQGFVRCMFDDADNLAILEGVLTLSRGFSRVAIAEGIETVEHGTLLLQLGCEFGQGYGIARPMPATDIPGWIATWQRPAEWQNASRVSRDRLPLLIGDVEHRAWIRDIDTWLRGMRPAPPTVTANAGRFGRWLDTGGRVRYGASPAFRAVERLHAQMHDLADELLALHTRGRGAEALARVPELYALNARMRAQFGGFSIAFNDDETPPIAGPTSATGFGQPPP